MDLVEFLQVLTEDLNRIAESKSIEERSVCCSRSLETARSYLKNEKSFEHKCKALKQCLQFYGAARPLCEPINEQADALGQFIFLECSRLILGIEFQQCEDDSPTKTAFRDAVADTYSKLQNFLICQVFLVLQWLIVNGWNHPTLSAMMTGAELEEERAQTYLRSGEFPEIFKLRIEILIDQQCEDLALNLCSWCVRSPVFEHDVFVRKTHLLLLYKQGHDDFHDHCLNVPCCLLVKILSELENEPDCRSALLICQTALLQNWMHPEQNMDCCIETMLRCSLRLEKQQHDNKQEFLNSVNKILQLSVTNAQRRMLLKVMVELFNSEHLQFCSEVAVNTLKKDRFAYDASKIKRDEAECYIATAGLVETCRIVTKLFAFHNQMYLASMMTLFYLEPSNELYVEMQSKLRTATAPLPSEPEAPAGVDKELYKELFCIVEMLRPAHYHPTTVWAELRPTLVRHFIDSGFKYHNKSNAFVKIKNQAIPANPGQATTAGQTTQTVIEDDKAQTSTAVQSTSQSVIKNSASPVTGGQTPKNEVGISAVKRSAEAKMVKLVGKSQVHNLGKEGTVALAKEATGSGKKTVVTQKLKSPSVPAKGNQTSLPASSFETNSPTVMQKHQADGQAYMHMRQNQSIMASQNNSGVASTQSLQALNQTQNCQELKNPSVSIAQQRKAGYQTTQQNQALPLLSSAQAKKSGAQSLPELTLDDLQQVLKGMGNAASQQIVYQPGQAACQSAASSHVTVGASLVVRNQQGQLFVFDNAAARVAPSNAGVAILTSPVQSVDKTVVGVIQTQANVVPVLAPGAVVATQVNTNIADSRDVLVISNPIQQGTSTVSGGTQAASLATNSQIPTVVEQQSVGVRKTDHSTSSAVQAAYERGSLEAKIAHMVAKATGQPVVQNVIPLQSPTALSPQLVPRDIAKPNALNTPTSQNFANSQTNQNMTQPNQQMPQQFLRLASGEMVPVYAPGSNIKSTHSSQPEVNTDYAMTSAEVAKQQEQIKSQQKVPSAIENSAPQQIAESADEKVKEEKTSDNVDKLLEQFLNKMKSKHPEILAKVHGTPRQMFRQTLLRLDDKEAQSPEVTKLSNVLAVEEMLTTIKQEQNKTTVMSQSGTSTSTSDSKVVPSSVGLSTVGNVSTLSVTSQPYSSSQVPIKIPPSSASDVSEPTLESSMELSLDSSVNQSVISESGVASKQNNLNAIQTAAVDNTKVPNYDETNPSMASTVTSFLKMHLLKTSHLTSSEEQDTSSTSGLRNVNDCHTEVVIGSQRFTNMGNVLDGVISRTLSDEYKLDQPKKTSLNVGDSNPRSSHEQQQVLQTATANSPMGQTPAITKGVNFESRMMDELAKQLMHSQNPAPSADATQDGGRVTPAMSVDGEAKAKKSARLGKEVTDVFHKWLQEHPDKINPHKEDREMLAKVTGIDVPRIKNWFANQRRKSRTRTESVDSMPSLIPRSQSVEPSATPQNVKLESASTDSGLYMMQSNFSVPHNPIQARSDAMNTQVNDVMSSRTKGADDTIRGGLEAAQAMLSLASGDWAGGNDSYNHQNTTYTQLNHINVFADSDQFQGQTANSGGQISQNPAAASQQPALPGFSTFTTTSTAQTLQMMTSQYPKDSYEYPEQYAQDPGQNYTAGYQPQMQYQRANGDGYSQNYQQYGQTSQYPQPSSIQAGTGYSDEYLQNKEYCNSNSQTNLTSVIEQSRDIVSQMEAVDSNLQNLDDPSIYTAANSLLEMSLNDSSSRLETNQETNDESPSKAVRKRIKAETAIVLKQWFHEHQTWPFPTKDEIKQLCEQLNLTEKYLKTWFSNHRVKMRKLGTVTWDESSVGHPQAKAKEKAESSGEPKADAVAKDGDQSGCYVPPPIATLTQAQYARLFTSSQTATTQSPASNASAHVHHPVTMGSGMTGAPLINSSLPNQDFGMRLPVNRQDSISAQSVDVSAIIGAIESNESNVRDNASASGPVLQQLLAGNSNGYFGGGQPGTTNSSATLSKALQTQGSETKKENDLASIEHKIQSMRLREKVGQSTDQPDVEITTSSRRTIRKSSVRKEAAKSAGEEKRPYQERVFSIENQHILWSWMFHHLHWPTPSNKQAAALALITNSRLDQVYTWMFNTRSKKLELSSDGRIFDVKRHSLEMHFGVTDLESAKRMVIPWEELEQKINSYLQKDIRDWIGQLRVSSDTEDYSSSEEADEERSQKNRPVRVAKTALRNLRIMSGLPDQPDVKFKRESSTPKPVQSVAQGFSSTSSLGQSKVPSQAKRQVTSHKAKVQSADVKTVSDVTAELIRHHLARNTTNQKTNQSVETVHRNEKVNVQNTTVKKDVNTSEDLLADDGNIQRSNLTPAERFQRWYGIHQKLPVCLERKKLEVETGVDEKAIAQWFKNYKKKLRREKLKAEAQKSKTTAAPTQDGDEFLDSTVDYSVGVEDLDSTRESVDKKQARVRGRRVFTAEQTSLLRSWVFNHLDEPYPSKKEKAALIILTNSSAYNIKEWMGMYRKCKLVKTGDRSFTINNKMLKLLGAKDVEEAKQKVLPYEEVEQKIKHYTEMDNEKLFSLVAQVEGKPTQSPEKKSQQRATAVVNEEKSPQSLKDETKPLRRTSRKIRKKKPADADFNENIDEILSLMDSYEDSASMSLNESEDKAASNAQSTSSPKDNKQPVDDTTASQDEKKEASGVESTDRAKAPVLDESLVYNADGTKKTRCRFCRRYFENNAAKRRHHKECTMKSEAHKRQSGPDNPLCCNFCYKELESVAMRRRHEEFFCTEKVDKECKNQAEDVGDSEIEETIVIHSNKRQTSDLEETANQSMDGCALEPVLASESDAMDTTEEYINTKLFTCPKCGLAFNGETDFINHLQSEHSIMYAPYLYSCPLIKCKVKGLRFPTVRAVRYHYQHVHKKSKASFETSKVKVYVNHKAANRTEEAKRRAAEDIVSHDLENIGNEHAKLEFKSPRRRTTRNSMESAYEVDTSGLSEASMSDTGKQPEDRPSGMETIENADEKVVEEKTGKSTTSDESTLHAEKTEVFEKDKTTGETVNKVLSALNDLKLVLGNVQQTTGNTNHTGSDKLVPNTDASAKKSAGKRKSKKPQKLDVDSLTGGLKQPQVKPSEEKNSNSHRAKSAEIANTGAEKSGELTSRRAKSVDNFDSSLELLNMKSPLDLSLNKISSDQNENNKSSFDVEKTPTKSGKKRGRPRKESTKRDTNQTTPMNTLPEPVTLDEIVEENKQSNSMNDVTENSVIPITNESSVLEEESQSNDVNGGKENTIILTVNESSFLEGNNPPNKVNDVTENSVIPTANESSIRLFNGEFSCPMCDSVTYNTESSLLTHLRKVHGANLGPYLYSCPLCSTKSVPGASPNTANKKYTIFNGLRYHLLHTHGMAEHLINQQAIEYRTNPLFRTEKYRSPEREVVFMRGPRSRRRRKRSRSNESRGFSDSMDTNDFCPYSPSQETVLSNISEGMDFFSDDGLSALSEIRPARRSRRSLSNESSESAFSEPCYVAKVKTAGRRARRSLSEDNIASAKSMPLVITSKHRSSKKIMRRSISTDETALREQSMEIETDIAKKPRRGTGRRSRSATDEPVTENVAVTQPSRPASTGGLKQKKSKRHENMESKSQEEQLKIAANSRVARKKSQDSVEKPTKPKAGRFISRRMSEESTLSPEIKSLKIGMNRRRSASSVPLSQTEKSCQIQDAPLEFSLAERKSEMFLDSKNKSVKIEVIKSTVCSNSALFEQMWPEYVEGDDLVTSQLPEGTSHNYVTQQPWEDDEPSVPQDMQVEPVSQFTEETEQVEKSEVENFETTKRVVMQASEEAEMKDENIDESEDKNTESNVAEFNEEAEASSVTPVSRENDVVIAEMHDVSPTNDDNMRIVEDVVGIETSGNQRLDTAVETPDDNQIDIAIKESAEANRTNTETAPVSIDSVVKNIESQVGTSSQKDLTTGEESTSVVVGGKLENIETSLIENAEETESVICKTTQSHGENLVKKTECSEINIKRVEGFEETADNDKNTERADQTSAESSENTETNGEKNIQSETKPAVLSEETVEQTGIESFQKENSSVENEETSNVEKETANVSQTVTTEEVVENAYDVQQSSHEQEETFSVTEAEIAASSPENTVALAVGESIQNLESSTEEGTEVEDLALISSENLEIAVVFAVQNDITSVSENTAVVEKENISVSEKQTISTAASDIAESADELEKPSLQKEETFPVTETEQGIITVASSSENPLTAVVDESIQKLESTDKGTHIEDTLLSNSEKLEPAVVFATENEMIGVSEIVNTAVMENSEKTKTEGVDLTEHSGESSEAAKDGDVDKEDDVGELSVPRIRAEQAKNEAESRRRSIRGTTETNDEPDDSQVCSSQVETFVQNKDEVYNHEIFVEGNEVTRAGPDKSGSEMLTKDQEITKATTSKTPKKSSPSKPKKTTKSKKYVYVRKSKRIRNRIGEADVSDGDDVISISDDDESDAIVSASDVSTDVIDVTNANDSFVHTDQGESQVVKDDSVEKLQHQPIENNENQMVDKSINKTEISKATQESQTVVKDGSLPEQVEAGQSKTCEMESFNAEKQNKVNVAKTEDQIGEENGEITKFSNSEGKRRKEYPIRSRTTSETSDANKDVRSLYESGEGGGEICVKQKAAFDLLECEQQHANQQSANEASLYSAPLTVTGNKTTKAFASTSPKKRNERGRFVKHTARKEKLSENPTPIAKESDQNVLPGIQSKSRRMTRSENRMTRSASKKEARVTRKGSAYGEGTKSLASVGESKRRRKSGSTEVDPKIITETGTKVTLPKARGKGLVLTSGQRSGRPSSVSSSNEEHSNAHDNNGASETVTQIKKTEIVSLEKNETVDGCQVQQQKVVGTSNIETLPQETNNNAGVNKELVTGFQTTKETYTQPPETTMTVGKMDTPSTVDKLLNDSDTFNPKNNQNIDINETPVDVHIQNSFPEQEEGNAQNQKYETHLATEVTDHEQVTELLSYTEQANEIMESTQERRKEDEQLISVPEQDEQQDEQPISVPEEDEQPISVPEEDEQPISVPEGDEQPISVPEEDEQPISVPEEDEQPISEPERDDQKEEQLISVPEPEEQKNKQLLSVPEQEEQKIQQSIIVPEHKEQTDEQLTSVPEQDEQQRSVLEQEKQKEISISSVQEQSMHEVDVANERTDQAIDFDSAAEQETGIVGTTEQQQLKEMSEFSATVENEQSINVDKPCELEVSRQELSMDICTPPKQEQKKKSGTPIKRKSKYKIMPVEKIRTRSSGGTPRRAEVPKPKTLRRGKDASNEKSLSTDVTVSTANETTSVERNEVCKPEDIISAEIEVNETINDVENKATILNMEETVIAEKVQITDTVVRDMPKANETALPVEINESAVVVEQINVVTENNETATYGSKEKHKDIENSMPGSTEESELSNILVGVVGEEDILPHTQNKAQNRLTQKKKVSVVETHNTRSTTRIMDTGKARVKRSTMSRQPPLSRGRSQSESSAVPRRQSQSKMKRLRHGGDNRKFVANLKKPSNIKMLQPTLKKESKEKIGRDKARKSDVVEVVPKHKGVAQVTYSRVKRRGNSATSRTNDEETLDVATTDDIRNTSGEEGKKILNAAELTSDPKAERVTPESEEPPETKHDETDLTEEMASKSLDADEAGQSKGKDSSRDSAACERTPGNVIIVSELGVTSPTEHMRSASADEAKSRDKKPEVTQPTKITSFRRWVQLREQMRKVMSEECKDKIIVTADQPTEDFKPKSFSGRLSVKGDIDITLQKLASSSANIELRKEKTDIERDVPEREVTSIKEEKSVIATSSIESKWPASRFKITSPVVLRTLPVTESVTTGKSKSPRRKTAAPKTPESEIMPKAKNSRSSKSVSPIGQKAVTRDASTSLSPAKNLPRRLSKSDAGKPSKSPVRRAQSKAESKEAKATPSPKVDTKRSVATKGRSPATPLSMVPETKTNVEKSETPNSIESTAIDTEVSFTAADVTSKEKEYCVIEMFGEGESVKGSEDRVTNQANSDNPESSGEGQTPGKRKRTHNDSQQETAKPEIKKSRASLTDESTKSPLAVSVLSKDTTLKDDIVRMALSPALSDSSYSSSNDVTRYTCSMCQPEKRFADEFVLKNHLKVVHKIVDENEGSSDEKTKSKTFVLRCDLCNRKFEHEFKLQCHMKWFHSVRHYTATIDDIDDVIITSHPSTSGSDQKLDTDAGKTEAFAVNSSTNLKSSKQRDLKRKAVELDRSKQTKPIIDYALQRAKYSRRSWDPKDLDILETETKPERRKTVSEVTIRKLSKPRKSSPVKAPTKELVESPGSGKPFGIEPSKKILFRCLRCNFSCQSQAELSLHWKSHSPRKAPNYKCDLCRSSFNNYNDLKQHKADHSKRVNKNETSTSKTKVSSASVSISSAILKSRDVPFHDPPTPSRVKNKMGSKCKAKKSADSGSNLNKFSMKITTPIISHAEVYQSEQGSQTVTPDQDDVLVSKEVTVDDEVSFVIKTPAKSIMKRASPKRKSLIGKNTSPKRHTITVGKATELKRPGRSPKSQSPKRSLSKKQSLSGKNTSPKRHTITVGKATELKRPGRSPKSQSPKKSPSKKQQGNVSQDGGAVKNIDAGISYGDLNIKPSVPNKAETEQPRASKSPKGKLINSKAGSPIKSKTESKSSSPRASKQITARGRSEIRSRPAVAGKSVQKTKVRSDSSGSRSNSSGSRSRSNKTKTESVTKSRCHLALKHVPKKQKRS